MYQTGRAVATQYMLDGAEAFPKTFPARIIGRKCQLPNYESFIHCGSCDVPIIRKRERGRKTGCLSPCWKV
jgi:hypothetical protein